MLWLAVHFPFFPLEVLTRGVVDPGPVAVIETVHGRPRVCQGNATARCAGVQTGQGLGAARAMVAELRLLERDPVAERSALQRLAAWAGQFSPQLSLVPPGTMLLEVAGSLRLFGGPDALRRRVREGLVQLGYSACLAAASAPLAAEWLAAAQRELWVDDPADLHRALADLPISGLPVTEQQLSLLQVMGLSRVGELLRLPRRGLRQRLGSPFLDTLDKALGRLPDPRPGFVAPAVFDGRLDLPAEVADASALLFAARRLLLELEGMLRLRHAGVCALRWQLGHSDGTSTRLAMTLQRPQRSCDVLLALLRERLERARLESPVVLLGVRSDALEPLSPEAMDLFGGSASGEACADLLDLLRARLGRERVHGLAVVADRRPERAWRYCAPGTLGSTDESRGRRPLWLLPQPEPLCLVDGELCWGRGRLELEPERERLETGWWDGQPVRRDYRVARTADGLRLWVFLSLEAEPRWFVQGVFG